MTTGTPSPPPPQLPRIAGVSLELWAVIALFAGSGAYLVVNALIALPDTFDVIAAGGPFTRLGLLLLILVIVIGALGAGLVAIALLLYQASRVGRGLAYVAAGVVTLSWMAGSDRDAALTVAAILSIVAIVILAAAPAVREHFTGPNAPAQEQPTSVVVFRVLLALVIALLVLYGLTFLIVADIKGEYAVLAIVLLAAAAGGAVALRRLARPDRQARVAVTIGAGVAAVAILAFSERNSGIIVVLGVLAAIVATLWVPPDARAWFGDAPLEFGPAAAPVGAGAGTAVSPPPGADAMAAGAPPVPRPAAPARAPGPARAPRGAVTRHLPSVEPVAPGGRSELLGVEVGTDGIPALASDEMDLGVVRCRVAAGWLGTAAGRLSSDDLSAAAVVVRGTGVVRLTSRRLLAIATEGGSVRGPVGPLTAFLAFAVPLEAIQLVRHDGALAVGLRDRFAAGWLRLAGDDFARLAAQLVHVAASRRLQLNRRDRRRAQLEALHAGRYEGPADLGGELHLWEPEIAELASSAYVVPAPAPAPVAADAGVLAPSPPPAAAFPPPAATAPSPAVAPPPPTPPPPSEPTPPVAAEASTAPAAGPLAPNATPVASPEAVSDPTHACLSCGGTLVPGDQFCTVCGVRVS